MSQVDVRSRAPASYEVVKTQPTDALQLLGDLRQADREEWVAASGDYVLPCLLGSIKHGNFVRTVKLVEPNLCKANGVQPRRPLLIYGAHHWGGYALGWLIATNEAVTHGYALHRLVWRECLAEVHRKWRTIRAYSDCRNQLHHEWMVKLGFDLVDKVRYGAYSLPFYVFERQRTINED